MLVFVKLGGSLITDKRVERSFRLDQMERIALEIKTLLSKHDDLQLLLGHGSGSFGHFEAARHDTINGVRTLEDWQGFAEVADAAAQLNELVMDVLRETGIPALRFQPSASLICEDGDVVEMSLEPIQIALEQRIVPVVYGDVAVDRVRGGTIASTERIFFYLAKHLPVNEIVLLGEVDGVLDIEGQRIREITPTTLPRFRDALGGSAGQDVTGGMLSKVSSMIALVKAVPGLRVRIVNGTLPGSLSQVIEGASAPGTVISA